MRIVYEKQLHPNHFIEIEMKCVWNELGRSDDCGVGYGCEMKALAVLGG